MHLNSALAEFGETKLIQGPVNQWPVWKWTLPVLIPDKERKLTEIFIFTLPWGASKGFMKAFKSFKKPFDGPQRSSRKKISANFYFNATR